VTWKINGGGFTAEGAERKDREERESEEDEGGGQRGHPAAGALF
jgi:hypothetical protein